MKRGVLVTADGTEFIGSSVGAEGVATGEVVFNTAMTGYQEILTDPSYAGQVVVMTAPHIGNYGSTPLDDQSEVIHATGMVARSMSRVASSWRSAESFEDYLIRRNVIALSDIDTRRLTRHIRDHGSMPVAIGTDADIKELADRAGNAPKMAGRDLVTTVTTQRTYGSEATTPKVGTVVAYDFGIKRDIVAALNRRGLDVVVVPASTTASEALALDPDAVFLSNGPGDPEPLTDQISAVRSLLGAVPVFGICLGHQVLSLALGATTFKLPFGHHGGNHPVRRISDGSVEITSQNHGFAVDLWSLTDQDAPVAEGLPTPDMLPATVSTAFGAVSASHQNLNDGTNEGIECHDVAAFSVQYHPEAAPGPNDAVRLFDRFAGIVEARHG